VARRKPISVRLSQEFEALLAQASDNQSAAIRALLLVGANEVGLDLRKVRSDLLHTLAHGFPEPIDTRLRALDEELRDGGKQEISRTAHKSHHEEQLGLLVERTRTSDIHPQPSDELSAQGQELSDPLLSIGFDFEA
jgi:hypothetical protein